MNHTSNVPAHQRLNNADWEDVAPGTFQLVDKDTGLTFVCPCGCGSVICLPFVGRITWQWDGDRTHPTLRPSIRQLRGCRWHGHLVAGVWQPDGDSGK
jgi:hypothetical protein